MTIPLIVPGAGYSGWTATSTPADQGSAGRGYTKTAFGRHRGFNFRTYKSGYKVGVMAAHGCGPDFGNNGIAKISAAANNGTWVDATAPTQDGPFNDWAWWFQLDPLATDAGVELRFALYPYRGKCRVLQGGFDPANPNVGNTSRSIYAGDQSLFLYSNAQGSYDDINFYVDSVNGSTGFDGLTISTPKPQPTDLNAVIAAVAGTAGKHANGAHCVINYAAGTYHFPRGGTTRANTTGWLFHRRNAGVTRDQVRVIDGSATGNTDYRMNWIEDIWLDQTTTPTLAIMQGISSASKLQVAFEGTRITGAADLSNAYFGSTNIFVATSTVFNAYMVGSVDYDFLYENFSRGPGGANVMRMAHGEIGTHGGDFGTGCKDVWYTSYQPSASQVFLSLNHPDWHQANGTGSQCLYGNNGPCVGNAQMIFNDSDITDNTDKVFINCALEFIDSGGGPLISQTGCWDHVLMWNCMVYGQRFQISSSQHDLSYLFQIWNCIFEQVIYSNSGAFEPDGAIFLAAYLDADYNHYTTPGTPDIRPGNPAHCTTGNPLFVNRSARDYRITRTDMKGPIICPWDLNNVARSATTNMGPYEADGAAAVSTSKFLSLLKVG